MTPEDLTTKLESISERLIVLEQKIIGVAEKLEESKDDRSKIRSQIDDLQQINLKTKSFIGAVVFVVTSVFSIVITFKEQVLHFIGVK